MQCKAAEMRNGRRCGAREVWRASGFGADGGEVLVVGDGNDAVAVHGRGDAGEVGDSVLGVEAGEFLVVLRTHDAGGLKTEDAGGGVMAVLVEMRYASGDEEDAAAGDGCGLVEEGPGHVSVEAEDGLVIVAMNVRHGHVDEGRNGEFEEIEDTSGFVACLVEGDGHGADANCSVHELLFPQF